MLRDSEPAAAPAASAAWDAIPLRLCVDRFLPAHLHQAAGQLACQECPRNAVLLNPADILAEDDAVVFRNAAFTAEDAASLVFQRLGLLRCAKWDPGRTISIGFYPDAPDRTVTSRIMAILEESSEVLNLHWRQVPVEQAEYRVAFVRGNGLWSYIGSQCVMVQGQPTCNLGDVNWADPRDLIRCVRHEIVGHGTGAMHAQSLETYTEIIDLDLPAILDYYQKSQGWTYDQAAAQFRKVANAEVEQGLQSRTSIMAYEVNPRFDRRGVGVPFNWDWDATDKAQFRLSYPRSDQPAPPPPVQPDDPPPADGVPMLRWRKVLTVPYRAGGISRMRLRATGPTNLVVRVQDLAAGTPMVDVVGGATISLSPRAGATQNVVRFTGRLASAGDYDVLVKFIGVAPASFKIVAERG